MAFPDWGLGCPSSRTLLLILYVAPWMIQNSSLGVEIKEITLLYPARHLLLNATPGRLGVITDLPNIQKQT